MRTRKGIGFRKIDKKVDEAFNRLHDLATEHGLDAGVVYERLAHCDNIDPDCRRVYCTWWENPHMGAPEVACALHVRTSYAVQALCAVAEAAASDPTLYPTLYLSPFPHDRTEH